MARNIQRNRKYYLSRHDLCKLRCNMNGTCDKLPGIESSKCKSGERRLSFTMIQPPLATTDIVARVRKAGYDVPQVAADEEDGRRRSTGTAG